MFGIVEFFENWFRTRPYQLLWWGAPALLALLVWSLFAFLIAGWTPLKARTDYNELSLKALRDGDYPTARIGFTRLVATGHEARAQNLFYLAFALAGLGQPQNATALIRLAAPSDKPSYGPAHLYVARSLLTSTNLTPQLIKEAELQLNQVLALEPRSTDAHELLGLIHFQRREWDAAKQHFSEIISARPIAMLRLAVIARENGDIAGTRGWADRAAKAYRDKFSKANADNQADRLAWVQALILADDYPEAVRVLENGVVRSGRPAYAPALADLYATWGADRAKAEPKNLRLRVDLVQKGLDYAANNTTLLQQLVSLSQFEGPEGDTARAAITRLLANGEASALLHFVLGSDAWRQGDTEKARHHFAVAFELKPNLPLIANNLAALLALSKEPDLPRAFSIIQPLVEEFPEDPHFRDTRGQILVRQEKWQDAVKDLEFALPKLPEKRGTHMALAQAYRGLGLQDLATEHDRLAQAAAPSPKPNRAETPQRPLPKP
jgi:tetratricopeptide (TPR) repeat protein